MDNQNIKAVAFVRVASTTQSEQEKSNGQQMRQISEYAQRHNIKIVKWFVQSGKQFDYAEVLNFCKRNAEVEQLLVTDIARLGRSLEQMLVLKHSLKGLGVTIRTCDGADHETPMGAFMDNLRIILSQTDSNIRSDLTKQRMLERVAEGFSVTRPPLGYERTLTNGLYQPTRFGETLGTILQAIADESLPLSRAISLLQTRHESITGTRPARQKVLRLISNPYYAGMLSFQDQQYWGKHQALITLEQHNAILELIKNTNNKTVKTEATE